jgi:hypothetical protein
MTKPTSTRAMAGQNLIVASVNTALTRRLIALECELATQASFEFTLDGHPVSAYVNDAGFDEVSVHAICRPTELGHEFIECAVLSEWRRFGEATVYSWLERRAGKYLQSTSEYHGTKEITAALGALVVEPLGFGTKPIKGGYDWHCPSSDNLRLIRLFTKGGSGSSGVRG